MWLKVMIFVVVCGFFPLKSYALTCTVAPAKPDITFPAISPLTTGDIETSNKFDYTCTRNVLEQLLTAATICFNIYATGTSTISTRKMTLTSGSATLNYQLYQNAGGVNPWGNQDAAGSTYPYVRITGLNLAPATGSLTIYGRIPGGQKTTPPGTYKDSYTSVTAKITANTDLLLPVSSCGTTTVGSFAFDVTATVNKQCNVGKATDINLTNINHTQTNIAGSTSFTIACTYTTPYFIGLSTTNGSTTGSGNMKSNTTGNTDLVPYQLYSTSGTNGVVWGNIISTNTISGVGTGLDVSKNIYVIVPGANYKPDTYADTVTINVTY
ncbi:spore coat U domain-containing protein [Kluyvera sichuanensis]|uniref:Csu type fimbrial protein n=1 Tax=Kluyvera sichuanensis TaxID=2725494 RepID=UPI0039F6451C